MTSISLQSSDSLSSGVIRRLTEPLLATSDSLSPTFLRVALGVVVLPHGLQKTLGWFGGYGFDNTMQWFGSIGVPAFLAVLAIAADTLGAAALIAGVATRLAAFAIGVNMVVATLLVHRVNGFFMNWSGTQAGEGFQFHILAAAMAVALAITGGGRLSIDRAISINDNRKEKSCPSIFPYAN